MLAGRYRLVRRIASGGMGTVHEGTDERLGRRVAVKVLREEYSDDPAFVERFRREALATAALSHPNIAQVFDTGDDAGLRFIVMEFVDGGHLGHLLHEKGRLSPQRAVSVASQVCSALAAAHAAGIVHRDIKPANVIVMPTGRVKVTDFGIAQAAGQSTLTGTGTVLGTAQYLSPEQASGKGATAASDVYAVGVMLFEMLTGSVPFTGDTPITVALRHIQEDVPPVRDLAPDVPDALGQVVARATAKDPRQRFADCGEMESALREALAAPPGGTPTAVLGSPGVAGGRPAETASRLAGLPRSVRLAAAAVVLAGALALGWTALSGNPSTPGADASANPGQPSARHPQPSTKTPAHPRRSHSPRHAHVRRFRGPVVPPRIVGRDAALVEERLKNRGYDVHKVDYDSAAPEGSVLATIPRPGRPLSTGQTVVLVSSTGKPPEEPSGYDVPRWLVGSDSGDAEHYLKEQRLKVTKVDVDSSRPKDQVVASYPAPGTSADAGMVVLAVSRGSTEEGD